MFGSKILEIVIGLIFIFLIYSLLASSIQELLSNIYSSRARMLRKAIRRMLVDEHSNRSFTQRLALDLRNFLIRLFPPLDRWWKLPLDFSSLFYRHPSIKYLGFSSKDKHPAYIKSETFAKTVCDILKTNGEGSDDVARISDTLLKQSVLCCNIPLRIEPETLFYIQTTWDAAEHDVEKFKELLAKWFDETMDLISLQYKKRMRINLFFIGFLLSLIFNINIIAIANKLSIDDKTRAELVTLSTSYLEANKNNAGEQTPDVDSVKARIDRLYAMMENEVYETNTFIAMGWEFPRNFKLVKSMLTERNLAENKDTAMMSARNAMAQSAYAPQVGYSLKKSFDYTQKHDYVLFHLYKSKVVKGKAFDFNQRLNWYDKVWYVLYSALSIRHVLGYLITAVAISFGAPFWFDLLSKVVKLKNTMKEEGRK